ncbi:MAG TPA: DMT family protein [Pirellulales bacterium]|nr:DMT family protein [Pirellulales bacterium]
MLTVVLLICSNTFMTIAWYGHLKFKTAPVFAAILISWSIAFFEYCFQVPANRYGYADSHEGVSVADPNADPASTSWWQRVWNAKFSSPQLKIIQEAITITAFVLFNALYLKDAIRLTDWGAFMLIFLAVVVMMAPRWAEAKPPELHAGVSPPSQTSSPQQPADVAIDHGANSSRPGDSR